MALTAVEVSGKSLPKECIGQDREVGGKNSSVSVIKDCLQHHCLYTARGKSDHANHANLILHIFAWQQVLKNLEKLNIF